MPLPDGLSKTGAKSSSGKFCLTGGNFIKIPIKDVMRQRNGTNVTPDATLICWHDMSITLMIRVENGGGRSAMNQRNGNLFRNTSSEMIAKNIRKA